MKNLLGKCVENGKWRSEEVTSSVNEIEYFWYPKMVK